MPFAHPKRSGSCPAWIGGAVLARFDPSGGQPSFTQHEQQLGYEGNQAVLCEEPQPKKWSGYTGCDGKSPETA